MATCRQDIIYKVENKMVSKVRPVRRRPVRFLIEIIWVFIPMYLRVSNQRESVIQNTKQLNDIHLIALCFESRIPADCFHAKAWE